MGEVVMPNPSSPDDAPEEAQFHLLDPLMAIAFGPRPGEPGSKTPAYESNMAQATALLKSMVSKLKAPKTKGLS
jgi:hypothetical protein